MSLTGATIQEILYTDNPNEGRVKINDNFKRLRYFLDEAASTYISTPGIGKTAISIDKEKPIGDIDGINTIFTLKNKPVDGSDHVYLNGVLQENGQDLDYTLNGKDIVFILPPLVGMRIICSYRT
jgi:hypothetical protein